MLISQLQRDNLSKALGLFIEAFRLYAVATLQKESTDWVGIYKQFLYPEQKQEWELREQSGTAPEKLIDYANLRGFALKFKDSLKNDFGRDVNKLPSGLEIINEVRNKSAHFNEITNDEFLEAFIQMKKIAKSLKMNQLEESLNGLQEGKETNVYKKQSSSLSTSTKPWFKNAIPHLDIKEGRLDESIFAANLSEVALGNGREIYNNPIVFFSKTYCTGGLRNVAKTVIKGLNGNEDAENRVISLQTGFGGGKTHTLISLFHVCKLGKKAHQSQEIQELLNYTGSPEFESANIAVFTNTTNDPANGRNPESGINIQTIWGELAYQLGGKESYEIIRKNDEQLIASAGLFKKVLEKCKPALILIDELADYCVKASARKAGNSSLADQTISFMQELTEAISSTNNCVAVITLPASPQEVGNTPEAQAILSSLQKRVSRVGADTQPVADDEIFEVIRRRLFEDWGDPSVIELVASKYASLYKEYHTEVPVNASKSEYKQRIIKSYPFHPELIDVFRIRWASHNDFQRTRGVLRLLAAIVSDLWKRQQSLSGSNLLIHPGEINFANLDAVSAQLKKLYGNGYDGVISADVSGSSSNAFKIDGNKKEYGNWNLTQSIASVILMNSFGTDGANKGISVSELKLNLIQPDSFNHNSINGALDELEGSAYYLYYAQTGSSNKRYWFHTKPNINILINQAKSDIKESDVNAEIVKRIKEKTNSKIEIFNVIVDPSVDLPEQQQPTLVILNPSYLANPDKINGNTKPIIERIATKKGNSERIYRNTILFLVCSEFGISSLQSNIRDYLACNKISSEYGSQIDQDQKNEIKRKIEEFSKQADTSLTKAYSIVIKYSVKNGIDHISLKQFKDTLDSQINNNLVSLIRDEEWLIDSVGLNLLRSNQLFPTKEEPIRVKDVYEAFIRYDDKPFISGKDAIKNSLLRYCSNGDLCIAVGDGKEFTKYFLEENVPFFDITDSNYWLIEKSLKPLPTASIETVEPIDGIRNTNLTNTQTLTVKPSKDNKIDTDEKITKNLNAIIVSGKVALEKYTELFNYFITPFAMNGNKIDIEVKFKINSTESNPINEDSAQYKSAKEACKQLNLILEEEI